MNIIVIWSAIVTIIVLIGLTAIIFKQIGWEKGHKDCSKELKDTLYKSNTSIALLQYENRDLKAALAAEKKKSKSFEDIISFVDELRHKDYQ